MPVVPLGTCIGTEHSLSARSCYLSGQSLCVVCFVFVFFCKICSLEE